MSVKPVHCEAFKHIQYTSQRFTAAVSLESFEAAFSQNLTTLRFRRRAGNEICQGEEVIHDPFPLSKSMKILCVRIYHSITVGSFLTTGSSAQVSGAKINLDLWTFCLLF